MAGVLSDRKKITLVTETLACTGFDKEARSLAGQGFYLPGVESGRKNNNPISDCRNENAEKFSPATILPKADGPADAVFAIIAGAA